VPPGWRGRGPRRPARGPALVEGGPGLGRHARGVEEVLPGQRHPVERAAAGAARARARAASASAGRAGRWCGRRCGTRGDGPRWRRGSPAARSTGSARPLPHRAAEFGRRRRPDVHARPPALPARDASPARVDNPGAALHLRAMEQRSTTRSSWGRPRRAGPGPPCAGGLSVSAERRPEARVANSTAAATRLPWPRAAFSPTSACGTTSPTTPSPSSHHGRRRPPGRGALLAAPGLRPRRDRGRPMGHMVEDRFLRAALDEALRRPRTASPSCAASPVVAQGGGRLSAAVTLADEGRSRAAPMGATGAGAGRPERAGIAEPQTTARRRTCAVTTKAHRGTALPALPAGGPLAILPCRQPASSIVWSRRDGARRLCGHGDDETILAACRPSSAAPGRDRAGRPRFVPCAVARQSFTARAWRWWGTPRPDPSARRAGPQRGLRDVGRAGRGPGRGARAGRGPRRGAGARALRPLAALRHGGARGGDGRVQTGSSRTIRGCCGRRGTWASAS
jgi:hypothetical protein